MGRLAIRDLVRSAGDPDPERLTHVLGTAPLAPVLLAAREVCCEGHGARVTYSPKVFLPLTQLCRDNCGYCTFAKPPRPGARAYMSGDEILGLARAAVGAGCR